MITSLRPAADVLGKVASVEADGVLVARLAAGDELAVGELFDRHGSFAFGLARRVTGSQAIAEDVVQDVFTALWTAPERFDPSRGSLRAYLGVQTYRRAVDAVRRDNRRRAREEKVATAARLDEPSNVPDLMDAAVVADVVRDAIARLPAEQRATVELVFWGGLTCREVAHALAIAEGTAKSRLRLAQSKLSEWLTPLSGELA